VAIVSRPGTRTDTVVIAAAFIIAVILFALPARYREALAGALRRTVDLPLVHLQMRAELARDAMRSHDRVAAVRDSAALQTMLVPELQNENERLRHLLGLSARLGWGFVPAEALQGSTAAGEDDQTLILTAGSAAGVRRFSPVVTTDGLVGMVETVDPRQSLAIMWTHPDFRVSAEAADGSAYGIIRPHGGSGAERYLLEMSGVPFRNAVRTGTLIVSSGQGGTYPSGIPIGTVVSEIRTPEAWARTYLVRPTVLPSHVGSVMVLLPQRVAGGVHNVWPQRDTAAAARADSAPIAAPAATPTPPTPPRDSAAIADSIARARARRARRDSIAAARRDSIRRDSLRADSLRRDSTQRARPDSTRDTTGAAVRDGER
jgi:rod shape-determining protein MreC